MAVDLKALPENVLGDIRECIGLARDDDSQDATLAQQPDYVLFEYYCEKHDLIGWAHQLMSVIDGLRAAGAVREAAKMESVAA